MFGKKKVEKSEDEKFLDQELSAARDTIQYKPVDDESYGRSIKNYQELVQMKKDLQPETVGQKIEKIGKGICKGAAVILPVVGTLVMAWVSYDKTRTGERIAMESMDAEDEMRMVHGRAYNAGTKMVDGK